MSIDEDIIFNHLHLYFAQNHKMQLIQVSVYCISAEICILCLLDKISSSTIVCKEKVVIFVNVGYALICKIRKNGKSRIRISLTYAWSDRRRGKHAG